VPLSPKAFDFLSHLLDRRPEAVAKTELIERLWPDTFVSDASLYNVVAEVRAAIGDAPRATRHIRTVPRYGYAFRGDARPAPVVEISRTTPSGLCLVSGPREWILSEGPNVVGRNRDCGVRVDSATLSRHHARIVVSNGEAVVEDLGSKNGTFVNGRRVGQRVDLKDGDQLQAGSVAMTYRILDTLPSTETRRA
jgi:hypothetical protein